MQLATARPILGLSVPPLGVPPIVVPPPLLALALAEQEV
jgi:hypothetical protein